MKRIGVLLSGCGNMDGSEMRETILTFLALDKAKKTMPLHIECMAPDIPQFHVVNHLTRQESKETRSVLIESARLARGQITALSDVDCSTLDGLLIPGGLGAAKNLSSFAREKKHGTLHPQVHTLIEAMRAHHRPVGAICIAPAVLSLIYGPHHARLTAGHDGDTAHIIESLGGVHVSCDVNEVCVDEVNRIVSTPAYMIDNPNLHDMALGIEKCVNQVLKWV